MIFPVALDLRNRQCLVVGTGAEAAGRVEQLCAAGASVHWVTQEALLKPPNCQVSVRPFESADLSACWLVILADFNAELAQRIGTACESAQIFFCAIDQPEFNSFSHMALISAPPLTLALSTAGQAPALARRLRQLLQPLFTPQVVAYFRQIAALRTNLPAGEERKQALTAAVSAIDLSGAFSIPESPIPAPSAQITPKTEGPPKAN
jgi:precorrin-2 dehydrogenase / sirohydrochlorin ferrochelatase